MILDFLDACRNSGRDEWIATKFWSGLVREPDDDIIHHILEKLDRRTFQAIRCPICGRVYVRTPDTSSEDEWKWDCLAPEEGRDDAIGAEQHEKLAAWLNGFVHKTQDQIEEQLGTASDTSTWEFKEKEELRLSYRTSKNGKLSLYFWGRRVIKASYHLLSE